LLFKRIRTAYTRMQSALDTNMFNDDNGSDFSYFMNFIFDLSSLCVRLCFIIVCIGIPFYCVMKNINHGEYATHDYQYAWYASAAMMSKMIPSCLLFMIWFGCIFYSSLKIFDFKRNFEVADTSISAIKIVAKIDENSFFCSQYVSDETILITLTLWFNTVFSLVLNGVYVYIIITDDLLVSPIARSILQFFVAAVRNIWGQMNLVFINNKLFDLMSFRRKCYLLSWILILNDLVLPLLAILCIDPSCFLELIAPAGSDYLNYFIPRCEAYVSNTCIHPRTEFYTVHYKAFFTYNYQCGASVITTFVPVLLYSCTISAFISFMFQMIVYMNFVHIFEYAPIFIIFTPFKFMYSPQENSNTCNGMFCKCISTEKPLLQENNICAFNAPGTLALMVKLVAIILSFGLLNPYLAISASLAAYMIRNQLLAILFCYLEQKGHKKTFIGNVDLEKTTLGSRRISTSHIYGICSSFSAVTVGLLVADMSSDDARVSWTFSFILPIVAIIIILVLLIYHFHQKTILRQDTKSADINSANLEMRNLSNDTSPSWS
jgi:hypothetical protein